MKVDTQSLITILLFLLNLIMSLLLLWFRAELKSLHVEIAYLREIISRLEKRLERVER